MTEEEDPEHVKMKMYEAQAIVIEKEAEMEELRKRIEELERERLERNQVWVAISKLEESNAFQKQRVEQSERRLEESMRNIQNRLESVEETDTRKLEETETIKIIPNRVTALEETEKFDRIERRLEEIVATLETNGAENTRILERVTTLEDRIKGANETILIIGGERNYKDLDEMVLLDRKTSTWKVLNLKLPCKNRHGGPALLNSEIYIFGGSELKKKLYKLDSQQMRWIEMAKMKEIREYISNSSLVFQGCIWVFGGWNGKAALKTVEKYCPERNEWIEMPGMTEKRYFAAAAVCNGKLFVSGGFNGAKKKKYLFLWDIMVSLKSVECFDPTSGVWTPMVDMPGIRWGHSMISDCSSLFVMGGRDGVDNFTTVWRIRPSEENAIWEELQPMNELRSHCTAESLCCSTIDYKTEIYAIGGWNDDKKCLDSVEIFDGGRWREGPKLPNACHLMSSVVIPSSLAEKLFST